MVTRLLPVVSVGDGLGRFASRRGEGRPGVRVSGAVQVAAVQGDALGAAAVGAAVQLGYALRKTTDGEDVNLPGKRQSPRVSVPAGAESHPLLPLDQLRRKILVELLLPHVSGFDLHAVLQHVDVVGLSVHCKVMKRYR